MEKNRKIARILTILVISIILIVGLVIFIFNFSLNDSSYSIVEKKWIADNKVNVVDVNVFNDVPVYGYNGSGVIFDFLDRFGNDNDINFNEISYYTSGSDINYSSISFRVLNDNEEILDKDILLYSDSYVILSLDNNKLNDLSSVGKIGINKSDKDIVSYYFSDDCEYVEYDSDDKVVEGLINKEVSYVMVPGMLHMDDILSNDLNIVYNMTDISKKYVLRIDDDTVYGIFNKYYNSYLVNDFRDSYSSNYLNIYFNSKNVRDLDRKNYNSKVYRYGYVVNMPYENIDSSGFVGVISNYLADFERIFNVEIDTIKYDTVDEVKTALINGDIDLALTNFDYSNLNMDSVITNYISNNEYVIISKNNMDAKDIKSFKNNTINVVGSSYLYNICKNNDIKVAVFKNTNDLIRNIGDDSVVIMDYGTYVYYKNSKLKDYNVVYRDVLDDGYRFIVNKNSSVLEGLIDYYVNSTSYNSVRFKYNTKISLGGDYSNVKIVSIIGLIIVLLSISLFFTLRGGKNKAINKDDRLKYIDPMTSLKNRNYLNQNIDKWDDNVIFPQCIIMVDLNGLKEINDKDGRIVGDEVVKKAASILINNQKENSDILRSSGDEFLIYMVGYEEDVVKEYIRLLNREFKNIPNGLGASFGYSMIYDEVKIIDDAINEALIMLENSKNKK